MSQILHRSRFLSRVSQRRWKHNKHVAICVILRYLCRRKQLPTILSRLCYCDSYSFSLEHETAITKAIDEVDTYLTIQIVTGVDNLVVHSERDNLNKILRTSQGILFILFDSLFDVHNTHLVYKKYTNPNRLYIFDKLDKTIIIILIFILIIPKR